MLAFQLQFDGYGYLSTQFGCLVNVVGGILESLRHRLFQHLTDNSASEPVIQTYQMLNQRLTEVTQRQQ